MSDLEALLRTISERNKRERAEADSVSARMVKAILSDTSEELDELNRELAESLRRLLHPEGEDPAMGGTVGGGGSASESSGEPPQQ